MNSHEFTKKIKAGIKSILNHTTLWVQLTVFMILVITVISFGLIYKDYTSTRNLTINNLVNTTSKILNLEVKNVNLYFNNLANFCIQPYYDSKFTRLIEKKTPLTTKEISYIKQQLYYYYYTRSDLRDYELYLVNHNLTVGRTNTQQHFTSHFTPFDCYDISLDACEKNPYHQYLERSESGYLTYYHTLFQVKGKTIQAMVRLELNDSYTRSLTASHSEHGEIIVLTNQNHEIIFSNRNELEEESGLFKESLLTKQTNANGYDIVEFSGIPYLLISAVSKDSDIFLYSLMPLSYIDSQISMLQKSIIAGGFLIWLFTIILIYGLLRLLTTPLKMLSAQMQRTGKGDFQTHIDAKGSIEICELSQSFNSMVTQIDQLIRYNYLSEIREKDAKLAALEAQLNPHFLYNTLQAISTEALVNDQFQIHKMITALASNLRYTIKGKTLVPIQRELEYVKDYIFLQKMRMDDALDFQIDAEPEAMEYLIPKISIQALVENSIIHGKSSEKSTISIYVTVHYINGKIKISIKDDGCGISSQLLSELYSSFDLQENNGKYGGIGLANLYNRLQILYQEPATLDIQTQEGAFTEIILTVPAIKESACIKL